MFHTDSNIKSCKLYNYLGMLWKKAEFVKKTLDFEGNSGRLLDFHCCIPVILDILQLRLLPFPNHNNPFDAFYIQRWLPGVPGCSFPWSLLTHRPFSKKP